MSTKKASKNPAKGKKMTPGTGWRLIATKGKHRKFKGTLIDTMNFGGKRLAIFSVPNR
ncbi:MAG: hypothetical protein WCC11_05660 [Gammaproteobacteria bacterium]